MTTARMEVVLAQLDQKSDMTGVPISRLIDARHKLTALIKGSLDGVESKVEGRAALIARNGLDDFFFHTTDDMLVKGKGTDLTSLKRAIILETFAELLDIMEISWRRFGRSGRAAKSGMLVVASDPDLIERFNEEDRAKIRAIAFGYSLFAKQRLNKLLLSIRVRAGKYMPQKI